ncbi:MAG: glutamyl-tRNA reductase, partial [Acidobacteria bacterium]
MLIQLIGLNHKTAPVELRERLHIPEETMAGALQVLHQRVPEGLIFSTCNRFEVLAQADSSEASDIIVSFIS